MKNARLTLCLVVLVSITSCLAEAKDRDPVQLTIYASPQIAKELAKRTLEGLDYSVSRDDVCFYANGFCEGYDGARGGPHVSTTVVPCILPEHKTALVSYPRVHRNGTGDRRHHIRASRAHSVI